MRSSCNKRMSVESLFQVGGEGLSHRLDANTFVLKGEYPVLIECGSKLGYDRLTKNLGRVGVRAADIKAVLVTHGHWDHVSGMERLFEESDALLFVPAEDIDAVESGDQIGTAAHYYNETASPIRVDGEVDDDFVLETPNATISTIKTPWHTPGSVCYRIEQANSTTVIAADTLYGFYFFTPERDVYEDIGLGRDSLRRLRMEARADLLAIGHSMMGFKDDVETRLEEAERQFAPGDIELLLRGEDQPGAYVNLWHKPDGQRFNY